MCGLYFMYKFSKSSLRSVMQHTSILVEEWIHFADQLGVMSLAWPGQFQLGKCLSGHLITG